jgi:hypothetical protein
MEHHREGRRLEPLELVEEGPRVAVKLAVTDPHWSGRGEVFKVFTFREAGDEVVLMEDCSDEEMARALLARP